MQEGGSLLIDCSKIGSFGKLKAVTLECHLDARGSHTWNVFAAAGFKV